MKVEESRFTLGKLNRIKNGGLHIEYETKHVEESSTFINNEKTDSSIEPHEDLLVKVRALKPYLCEVIGFNDVLKVINHEDFKSSKPQQKTAEIAYDNRMKDVEITGFSINGYDKKRNVIISGKLTIQKLGVVALNTPRIKFSNDLYGWEDELEEIINDLQSEAYKYLFEQKRAQLKMFGEEE